MKYICEIIVCFAPAGVERQQSELHLIIIKVGGMLTLQTLQLDLFTTQNTRKSTQISGIYTEIS